MVCPIDPNYPRHTFLLAALSLQRKSLPVTWLRPFPSTQSQAFPAAAGPVAMALGRGRVNGLSFGRSPRLARCTVLLVAVAAIAAVLQHVLAFISGSYAETRTFLAWMRAAFAERGNLCKDRSYQRLATEPVC